MVTRLNLAKPRIHPNRQTDEACVTYFHALLKSFCIFSDLELDNN